MDSLSNNNATMSTGKKWGFLILSILSYVITTSLVFTPYVGETYYYGYVYWISSLNVVAYNANSVAFVMLVIILWTAIFAFSTLHLTNAIIALKSNDKKLVNSVKKSVSLAGWVTCLYFVSACYVGEILSVLYRYNGVSYRVGSSYIQFLLVIVLAVVFSILAHTINKNERKEYLFFKKLWGLKITFVIIITVLVEFYAIGVSIANRVMTTSFSALIVLILVGCVLTVLNLKREKRIYVAMTKKEQPQVVVDVQRPVEQSKPEVLWRADKLIEYNESVKMAEKMSFCDCAQKMYDKINASGISITKNEVVGILSAMASAKVVLLKVSDPILARKFSEILSQCFSTHLFTEKYNQISTAMAEAYFRQIELNKKHSVESGTYVAYYMGNFITTVFFDGFSDTLSAKAERYYKTLAGAKESIHLGEKEYLEENAEYTMGKMPTPENLWAVGLIGDDYLSYILKFDWTNYVAVVPLDIEEKEVEENIAECTILYPHFINGIERAQEDFYLTEANWQKFDKLENYLINTLGFGFTNRFLRQMECFVSVFLSIGGSQEEAIDAVLSMRILPYLAKEKETLTGEEVEDFAIVLGEIFGNDFIPQTRETLVSLGLKK